MRGEGEAGGVGGKVEAAGRCASTGGGAGLLRMVVDGEWAVGWRGEVRSGVRWEAMISEVRTRAIAESRVTRWWVVRLCVGEGGVRPHACMHACMHARLRVPASCAGAVDESFPKSTAPL